MRCTACQVGFTKARHPQGGLKSIRGIQEINGLIYCGSCAYKKIQIDKMNASINKKCAIKKNSMVGQVVVVKPPVN